MNPSPPPSAAVAATANQSVPSSQSLPNQPPHSFPSTATPPPPLKKPSSAKSTVRPATDHHWYNKQVSSAAYPQPQSASLNPPNPNPNSSNLQLKFPNQQETHGLMYPVGTSSRGGSGGAFALKNSNNSNSNASRPANGGDRSAAHSLQQLGRPDSMSNQQLQFLNSGYLNPSHPALAGGGSMALQGFPVTSYSKVGFSVATDRNGNREARSKDDSLAVVLNRKVRMSEGSSLYSLCRSWLKNGVHDQYQPKQATRHSYLPRPLPTPPPTPSQKSNETEEVEEDEKEDEKSVEHMSSEDLLQRHIQRAKRVRSRLREERLHRITRYKNRLISLLPSPPVEPFRDETPIDN